MVRGGKEGRVYGPLLVIPYLVWKFEFLKKERNEYPLLYWPRKGICRRMEVLKLLAPKRLCYGMAIEISIEKIHLPPILVQMWNLLCKNGLGMYAWIVHLIMLFYLHVGSCLSHGFLDALKTLEKISCESPRREFNRIATLCERNVFKLWCIWQWGQVFLLVLSQWSLELGWLIGENDWETFLHCVLCYFSSSICALMSG